MYRNLLLLVHLVSVAAWLGADLTQLFVGRTMLRHPDATAVRWATVAGALAMKHYNAAGTALFVTGALLVRQGPYELRDGFVGVGLAMLLLGGVQGLAYFVPQTRRMRGAAELGDSTGLMALRQSYDRTVALDAALVTITALAMVTRWLST